MVYRIYENNVFYKNMRTESLIISHVQTCSDGSISRGKQSNHKITFFVTKGAHGFADHFARAEMSIRVAFEA